MAIDTQLIDQQGFGFLSSILARINCTLNSYHHEVGIDGIIELRSDSYKSTGILLSLQLKSGDSYFSHQDTEYFKVYIDVDHIHYWLKCTLPVLFVIYSPTMSAAFWTKIDKNLLIANPNSYTVLIPKSNNIAEISQDDIYRSFYGRLYTNSDDFRIILNEMQSLSHIERDDIYVSAFELFLNSLIDTCNQLYFHTDVYSELMNCKIEGTDIRGFSFPDSAFYDNYFQILNYHNLIRGDFHFEIETIREQRMVPQFIKPLSLNGKRYLEYLKGAGYDIQTRFFVGIDVSSFYPYIDKKKF